MNGSEYDTAVNRYLDGEMSPREKETFELRLAGDRELTRTVEAERLIRTAARIDRSRYLSASATSTARFEQLVTSLPSTPPMASYLRWLLGGTGLAVVAVAVLLITGPRDTSRPEPQVDSPARTEMPAALADTAGAEPDAYASSGPDSVRTDSSAERRAVSSTSETQRVLPASTDDRTGASTPTALQRTRAAARPDSTHSERTQMEIKMRTPEIKQNP